MTSKIARLIITFECRRSCSYCCNKYSSIMKNARSIRNVDELSSFDQVLITGGEPMLNPDRTLQVIGEIRQVNPDASIFLYSAWYDADAMPAVLNAVDGLQFTLHAGSTEDDIAGFHHFQALLEGRPGSYRLYINPQIKSPINIKPYLWRRVEVKPWLTEKELLALQPGGLPLNEVLLILESSANGG